MGMVSRDPFARTELHKISTKALGKCDWCGQLKIMHKFVVESDGGRKSEIRGRFCSVVCCRSYNGN